MSITKQIAKHFREVIFGGNWTCVNVKTTLADVTWLQATTKVQSFNTIATLVYHTNYYVAAVSKVLQGEPLNAKDEYSFSHPPIESAEDWAAMVHKTLTDAEAFAAMIEQLPDSVLEADFTDKKYGSYYRNLHGIIEHYHYHLGQIVIIKKTLQERAEL